MDSLIDEIAESLKSSLTELWKSKKFAALDTTLRSYLSRMKQKELKFSIEIHLAVISRDKPMPIARIPLATIITTTGFTGASAKKIGEWAQGETRHPEEIPESESNAMRKLFEGGMKDPIYDVRFGIRPSLGNRVAVCKNCSGEGYTFNSK